MQNASLESVIDFGIICAVVVTAFLAGVKTGAGDEPALRFRRTVAVALGTLLWLSLILLVVWSGWLEADRRRVLLFAFTINAVSLGVGFSPIGGWLARVPVIWLVAFQGFRLPLELVLHSWVKQGVIPETMTWTGLNWDIVSGLCALLAAPLCRRSLAWAWLANSVGLVLLVNVMRVALLSSPVPFGWPVLPKLTLVFHIPSVLILPVCIGGALIGHIALTRALLTQSAGPNDRTS